MLSADLTLQNKHRLEETRKLFGKTKICSTQSKCTGSNPVFAVGRIAQLAERSTRTHIYVKE